MRRLNDMGSPDASNGAAACRPHVLLINRRHPLVEAVLKLSVREP